MPDYKITITRRCPFCGKHYERSFLKSKLDAGLKLRDNGYKIQDAFPEPDFTDSDREFLLSGICDDCWEKMSSACDELI